MGYAHQMKQLVRFAALLYITTIKHWLHSARLLGKPLCAIATTLSHCCATTRHFSTEEVGQARLLNLVHLQNIQSVVARGSWRATMNNRIQEPACGLQSPEVYISSSSVAMHVHE